MMSASDSDSDSNWTVASAGIALSDSNWTMDSSEILWGMSDTAFTVWACRVAERERACYRLAFIAWVDALVIAS